MRILLTILACFITCLITAQQYEYCTIKQVENKFVLLQEESGQIKELKDASGNSFTDLLKAYLFMEESKWEYVMSYAKHVQPGQPSQGVLYRADAPPPIPNIENSLVFRKKKSQGQE